MDSRMCNFLLSFVHIKNVFNRCRGSPVLNWWNLDEINSQTFKTQVGLLLTSGWKS